MKLYFNISILLLLFLAGPLYARDMPFDSKDLQSLPIDIKAEKLFQDNQNNIFVAKGNAELHQGTRTLTADYIKYNITTQTAQAKGNVTLKEGSDIIRCDAFKIDFNSQIGEVHKADIFLKQDNFHISGKEIKKISENNYSVENGTITTCDGPNPLWRIDAKSINLTVEGYAHVKNSFFMEM